MAAADRVYADAEAALGPKQEVLLTRSLLAFHHGDLEAAQGHASRALATNPEDVEVNLILSEIAGQRGDLEGALAYAQEAWRLRPQQLSAASRLAWVLATTPDAQRRDGAQALRVIEAALPDPDAAGPDALDVLAACQAPGPLDDAVRARRA
jgi:Flp pilus assembly protein TadD